MKKYSLFLRATLIVLFALVIVAPAKDAKPKPYPLKVCIVAGEKLGSMGKPVVIKHEGVTVKFCCKGCIEDFEEDPEKFIAKLEAAKNGELPKPAQEKPETNPENKENQKSETEKPTETKPKDSEGEGKKPAEQGDGEKE